MRRTGACLTGERSQFHPERLQSLSRAPMLIAGATSIARGSVGLCRCVERGPRFRDGLGLVGALALGRDGSIAAAKLTDRLTHVDFAHVRAGHLPRGAPDLFGVQLPREI